MDWSWLLCVMCVGRIVTKRNAGNVGNANVCMRESARWHVQAQDELEVNKRVTFSRLKPTKISLHIFLLLALILSVARRTSCKTRRGQKTSENTHNIQHMLAWLRFNLIFKHQQHHFVTGSDHFLPIHNEAPFTNMQISCITWSTLSLTSNTTHCCCVVNCYSSAWGSGVFFEASFD